MSSPRERMQSAIPTANSDEPEVDIWAGDYSAKTMIGWWIGGGMISLLAPLVLVITSAGETIWLAVLVLIAAMWLWLVGVAVYRKFSNYYELTSQRLKHRSGILFRKANRIELIDIDDVMYEQGPVQAMMDLGTITIRSSDTSHPELQMVGIAHVRRVADKIDDARRAERRKRGLHIEAV